VLYPRPSRHPPHSFIAHLPSTSPTAPLLTCSCASLCCCYYSIMFGGWFGGAAAPEWAYPELETPLTVRSRHSSIGLALGCCNFTLTAHIYVQSCSVGLGLGLIRMRTSNVLSVRPLMSVWAGSKVLRAGQYVIEYNRRVRNTTKCRLIDQRT
jgi:hypothetical protein